MAAANLSRDVLEMFYGPIEENQRGFMEKCTPLICKSLANANTPGMTNR